MTTVILDIPTDKMKSFIQMVVNLGIENHTIQSGQNKTRNHKYLTSKKRFSNQFLLFDWEFFDNELEFE